jgi:hypothetical protein
MVAALSSSSSDGTPELAPDGLTIFFGTTRPGGMGSSDIWSAQRFSVVSGWDMPAVEAGLNTTASDYTPVPSEDLLGMTFSSTRDGTIDLFHATRAGAASAWDAPVKITELSTDTYDDTEAFLIDAERVIYFSSDRPGGQGGRDLWRASRADAAAAFDAPTPVSELNSSEDEQDPWLSPDGRTIYFASDRTGNWEIYVASRGY